MRRKLFCAAVAMIAAILWVYYAGIAIGLLSAAPAVCGVLCLKNRTAYGGVRLILVFFTAGCLLMCVHTYQARHGILAGFSDDQRVSVRGVVTEVRQTGGQKWQLTVDTGGEKLLVRYYRQIDDPYGLIGREIEFSAVIEEPKEAGNPRTFDYQLYLRSRNIFYITTADSFSLTDRKTDLLRRFQRVILLKRERFFRDLQLPEQSAAMVRGILFGDTADLDEEVYDTFRKNGTAHVLAVSGLHIGIIYGLFRRLWEKHRSRAMVMLFLMILTAYGTAACWSVSVRRAVFLILLSLLGEAVQRRRDLLTSLSAAAMAVIAANPYVIFGASFQMSFLAVASMSFFTPVLQKICGRTLAPVLAVQLGLMPYMAYTFNYVSFVALIGNFPVLFLVSLLVPAGIAGFLLILLTGGSLPLLPQILDGLSDMIIRTNGFFSADGFLSFDVPGPPLWLLALVYGLAFFAASEFAYICMHRRDWKRVGAAVFLILAVAAAAAFTDASPFDRAQVVLVDVGQGDCLHLRTKDGRNLLIDGGGSVSYDVGKKILKPYLLKNGFSSVDLAAATHLHRDHYQGISELAACFPVGKIVTEGRTGQRLTADENAWLEILWPDHQQPESDDENAGSLIFKVHWYGISLLVTGDITAEGEAMLLEKYRGTDALKCDVLKVAHHGSAYSTSDDFLEAADPSVAVIGVGTNNYGHPSQKVIEKMQKKGIIVYRTDLDGAVGIRSKDGKITVCTKKR